MLFKLVISLLILKSYGCCPDEPLCMECSNFDNYQNYCTACDQTYFDSESGSCFPKVLDKIHHCKTYQRVASEIKCKICEFGFFLKNDHCLPCSVSNCAYCPEDKCSACFNSILFDSKSQSCSKDKLCKSLKCNICREDNGEDYCILCNNSYGLREDDFGKCLEASQNCEIVLPSNSLLCSKCYSGFYISSNKKCIENPKSNSLELGYYSTSF